MTPTLSPGVSSSRRIPCIAMQARAPKAACSDGTPIGTLAARLRGTVTNSAWDANPAPMQATSSPGRNGRESSSTSMTVPTLLYPRGVKSDNLFRTISNVWAGPWDWTRDQTCWSRSPEETAFSYRPRIPLRRVTAAPSVPLLINEYRFRTRIEPRRRPGIGASRRLISPWPDKNACFIEWSPPEARSPASGCFCPRAPSGAPESQMVRARRSKD